MMIDIFEFNLKFIMRKKTNIHPTINPSEPSIKFVKLIDAVIQITKKTKIKILRMGVDKNKSTSLKPKIRKEVNNWKMYLYFGDTLIKSSKKLINIKGIHNKDNEKIPSNLLNDEDIKS